MKKSIILSILISTIIFSGCGRLPEPMIDVDKLHFAFYTYIFDFQMVIDGEIRVPANVPALNVTDPLSPYFDPAYTELVFVHNEEQAQGFPDYVIVAWPVDRPVTQMIVDRMNTMVNRTTEELGNLITQRRESISLEDFGLTYPITIEDLVDSWEAVVAVWLALTESERMSLRP